MGAYLSYFNKQFYGDTFQSSEPFLYALFDPLQSVKPEGRTKDIISYKNKNMPNTLDTSIHKGCDTVWKCFKRSVWMGPDRPFMGERGLKKVSPLAKYNVPMQEKELGDYQW